MLGPKARRCEILTFVFAALESAAHTNGLPSLQFPRRHGYTTFTLYARAYCAMKLKVPFRLME